MRKQNIFGTTLRQVREDRKLTIRGFSEIIKFSPAYIVDLEKGNRNPSSNVIDAITQNIFLTEEEHEKLLVGYYTSHPRMEADIIYYIEKNGLLESLQTLKEHDKDGTKFKQFVKTLNPNK